jgi:hypothetical protein
MSSACFKLLIATFRASSTRYLHLTQSVAYEGVATGTPLSMIQICYNGNTTSCAAPSVAVGGELFNLITQRNTYTVYNSSSLSGAKEVITTYDCYTTSPCYGNVTSVANYDYGQTLLLS